MTNKNKPTTFPWHLLIIFILFTLVISVAGYLYYQNQKEQFKAQKHAELAAITKLKVKQIVEWKKERISDAKTILSNPYISDEMSAFIKNPSSGENYNRLFLWMSNLQENFDYHDVSLLGVDGKIYISLNGPEKELCALTIATISVGVQTKEIIFSDLHKDPSGKIHIDLIIPLLANNSVYGILLAEIDPSRFLYPLIQQWPTPSRSAESLLIRREGNDILFINELRHRKNTALSLRFPINQENLPASLAARDIEGIVEGNDYRGIPVLADVIKIPETPWYMVSKVDTNEIYQPLAAKAVQTGIYIFTLILSSFFVILFFWRNQRVSFYKKQYETEAERKALIRHFDYLSRYANDIILLMDNEGKIVEANERALKTYGYKLDELLNLNIENLQIPDSHPDVAQLMQKIEEKNGLIFEALHQRKDGSTFQVEVSARRMEIEGKYYFQSIIRDITEKKQAEEKLNKANRLYAFLSQVNQAIVREKDKQKLFQEICDIAIKYGKFRLAWIGFVDQESKLIKPAAFSGEGSDYLQNIEISVKDGLSGRGPSGRAIREGKSVVFNDLENNPDFAPWREQALEKGYRSSASFPIRLNNIVIGVFNVYAVEAHFFDQDEIKLLEEAALDISFALEKFEEENIRKQAEEALKESNENFQQVVSNITTVVWKADIGNDGAFENTYISPFVDELLELPAGTMKNDWDKYFSYIKPEYLERVNNAFKEAIMSPGKEIDCEYEVLKDTGQTAWFHSKGRCFEKNGKLYVFGSTMDITERKQAEEELIQKNEQFELVMQGANIGWWDWDISSGKEIYNEILPILLGYKFNEIEPNVKWWEDKIHPDDLKQVSIDLQEHFDGKTEFYINIHRLKTKTGIWKWFFDHGKVVTRDKDGKPIRMIGTLRDIDNQQRAEEALQESEKQLQTLIDAMPDFVCFKDGDGRWLKANDIGIRIFRLEGIDYRGKKDSELAEFNSKLQDSFLTCKESDARAWKEGRLVNGEETVSDSDGSIRVFDVAKVPLFYLNGERKGLIVLGHDITERKLAEEELAKHRENLEELVKERTINLEKMNAELKRFNKLFAGREFRIKELRDKVKELEKTKSD